MLDYYQAQWVYVLRSEFGCTYSRIRELMSSIYKQEKFEAHNGRDIVGYAYILLGKNKELEFELANPDSQTQTLLKEGSGEEHTE